MSDKDGKVDVPAGGLPADEYAAEKMRAITASRDAYKRELDDARTKLDKLTAEADERRKTEAAAAAKKEEEELLKRGEYEKSVAKLKADHEAALRMEREKYLGAFASRTLPTEIIAAATAVKGILPEALRDLPAMLASRIRVDPATLGSTVLTEDGRPALDADMKPMTVAKLVEDYVKARPYLLAATAPATAGQSSGGNGQTAWSGKKFREILDNPAMRAEYQKADPDGYAKAADAHFAELSSPKA